MIQRFLLVSLLALCTAGVQAQAISGRLKSPDGTSLRKATIQVKGKSKTSWTVTNLTGDFSLVYVMPGDTLIFSSIGYHAAYYIARETDTYIEGVLKPAALELTLRQLRREPSSFFFAESTEQPEAISLSKENVLSLRSSRPAPEEEGCYYTPVAVGPSMRDGLSRWNKLLETGIAAPRRAKYGQLEIAFVVDKDGRTQDIVIEKSYHRKVDRVIADYLFGHIKMWSPAVQNGFVTAVPCRLRFEVTTSGGTIHLKTIYSKII